MKAFLDMLGWIFKNVIKTISEKWRVIASISIVSVIVQVVLSIISTFLFILPVALFIHSKNLFLSFALFILILLISTILGAIFNEVFTYMFLRVDEVKENKFNFGWVINSCNSLIFPCINILIGLVLLFFVGCGINFILSIPFLILGLLLYMMGYGNVLIGILLVSLFFIIPLFLLIFILVFFFSSFYHFFILYENDDVLSSILKSCSLVKDNLLKVFGAKIVFFALMQGVSTIKAVIAVLPSFVIGSILGGIITIISSIIFHSIGVELQFKTSFFIFRLILYGVVGFLSSLFSWFVSIPISILLNFYLWKSLRDRDG